MSWTFDDFGSDRWHDAEENLRVHVIIKMESDFPKKKKKNLNKKVKLRELEL